MPVEPADRAAPRALVLRALGLGDLLVAVPALRLLARALPGHEIVLAAPAALAPVVERVGVVDVLLDTPSPADLDPTGVGGVDVAVNLHGAGPQSHAALDALAPRRRVGHAAPGWEGPDWTEDPQRPERRRWCDLLAATGLVSPADAVAGADDLAIRPDPGADTDATVPAPSPAPAPGAGTDAPVVIHPGAAFGAKRWPVERFAAVAAALAGRGHRVVVTGGADERALTARVAAAAGEAGTDRGGRTDLRGLLETVASARLVLSGDTGVAHLATALDVASVVLFGPVGPDRWGPPPGPRHVTLTDPGRRRGDRFAAEPDPALTAVGVDDVLAACDRVGPRGRSTRPARTDPA